MNRILIATAIAAASCAIAVPAVAGLAGNPSFNHRLPVNVPSQAQLVQFDEHGRVLPADDSSTSAEPTKSPSQQLEPGDNHGGLGDASGTPEPGEDHGGAITSTPEPGDDHGGAITSTPEPGDDHSATSSPEPGDDHGSTSSGDNGGSSGGSGDSGGDSSGGSSGGSGHGG
jgi:uncharacterized membrane protein YgcG